jgi:signal transduction histidine kinase
MFGEAAINGKSFAFEDYYENTDKYYNVNIYSPNPKQFTLLVTDITENKRKEIDLIEKYEELQAVYEELSATEEELRNNYKELEKANEELEKANKAKSQFLANMSHELRTPLNGILGCTQLLNHSKLGEEQNENVNIIEKSSKHLLELINNILDISKIESGKVELSYKRFNFLEQMDYIIKDLRLLSMNKDIEIMYYVDPLISEELIGDNLRLKQVLNNLISNAAKYTDHGHIYLKINQISKTIHETKLKFIVEDTGIGIQEDFKLKIFDIFTQEESSYTKNYSGTGLGLAISKELVEMMGGNIGFESEADKGSIFYFTSVFKNITDRNIL